MCLCFFQVRRKVHRNSSLTIWSWRSVCLLITLRPRSTSKDMSKKYVVFCSFVCLFVTHTHIPSSCQIQTWQAGTWVLHMKDSKTEIWIHTGIAHPVIGLILKSKRPPYGSESLWTRFCDLHICESYYSSKNHHDINLPWLRRKKKGNDSAALSPTTNELLSEPTSDRATASYLCNFICRIVGNIMTDPGRKCAVMH